MDSLKASDLLIIGIQILNKLFTGMVLSELKVKMVCNCGEQRHITRLHTI